MFDEIKAYKTKGVSLFGPPCIFCAAGTFWSERFGDLSQPVNPLNEKLLIKAIEQYRY